MVHTYSMRKITASIFNECVTAVWFPLPSSLDILTVAHSSRIVKSNWLWNGTNSSHPTFTSMMTDRLWSSQGYCSQTFPCLPLSAWLPPSCCAPVIKCLLIGALANCYRQSVISNYLVLIIIVLGCLALLSAILIYALALRKCPWYRISANRRRPRIDTALE